MSKECHDCGEPAIHKTDLEDVSYCNDCYCAYCDDKIEELQDEIQTWKNKLAKAEEQK